MEQLFKIIGIKPKNKDIYKEALTHKTYSNENKGFKSYEKLEFLGDSILQLCSTLYIYRNFNNVSEGTMSNIRAKNVSSHALSTIVKKHGINKYIICSNNIDELQNNEKICSDIFESLLAAIYLDLGQIELEKFLNKFLYPIIKQTPIDDNNLKDPKTRLQEMLQPLYKYSVNYETEQIGNEWYAKAKCGNKSYGSGKGKTKSDAETNAAKDALSKYIEH